MTSIVSKPDHGEQLIDEGGVASQRLQIYLDDIETGLNVFLLQNFTVIELTVTVPPATTPKIPASSRKNGMVMVSDETGGEVPAFSDGLNWRRVTDRAIIS